MRRPALTLGTILAAAGAVAITVAFLPGGPQVSAYERWDQGCNGCHGSFFDGTSPAGTVFPSNNKHTMHNGSQNMNADCALCHINVGDNPPLDESGGTANNPGVGCTGCHGRDYGGDIGNSAVGLRAHHAGAGISCGPCHNSDPLPLPESVLPTYYGTVDTNADDPCNAGPDFLENYSIGDTLGLDNDGDGLYDQDDPDCGNACPADLTGNGVVNVDDLLLVLGAWGPNPGGDVDGDGDTDVDDLLLLLGAWGDC